jgi:hypothetical protein
MGLVRVPAGTGGFSRLKIAQADSGFLPACCSVVNVVRSRRANRLMREANHSSPSSDEVKSEWRYTSLYAFVVWTYFCSIPCLFYSLRKGQMRVLRRIFERKRGKEREFYEDAENYTARS